MPPKKKARRGAADSPVAEPITFDGWTDEQETTLFKAISVYRLKPAGMHKHFRMVGISELMKNHGVSDSHTNIEGIWSKLKSLYNLEGLDEREDMDDEFDSPNPATQFTLPEDEYGHLMSARRLDPASVDSPPATSSENSFAASVNRYKKGRVIRSASIDESGTNSIAADDTEDESSLRSTSPSLSKGKKATPSSTRARKLTSAAAKRRSLPNLNAKQKPTPRRRAIIKAVEKPKDKEKDKESNAGEVSNSVAADDDDDDDELSDVPDDVDIDDIGTVAETEGGDEEGENRSEMGESTTNAESPPPTTPTTSKRGGSRGRGSRGRGGKRGGVRRSTRKK